MVLCEKMTMTRSQGDDRSSKIVPPGGNELSVILEDIGRSMTADEALRRLGIRGTS